MTRWPSTSGRTYQTLRNRNGRTGAFPCRYPWKTSLRRHCRGRSRRSCKAVCSAANNASAQFAGFGAEALTTTGIAAPLCRSPLAQAWSRRVSSSWRPLNTLPVTRSRVGALKSWPTGGASEGETSGPAKGGLALPSVPSEGVSTHRFSLKGETSQLSEYGRAVAYRRSRCRGCCTR
jgi:hypothetical protein